MNKFVYLANKMKGVFFLFLQTLPEDKRYFHSISLNIENVAQYPRLGKVHVVAKKDIFFKYVKDNVLNNTLMRFALQHN